MEDNIYVFVGDKIFKFESSAGEWILLEPCPEK